MFVSHVSWTRMKCVCPLQSLLFYHSGGTWAPRRQESHLGCSFNSLFRLTKRKHQSSTLLALCEGNHRWPVDSPHKGPVMQKWPPRFPDRSWVRSIAQMIYPLHWRHYYHDSVSNHQPYDGLLNHLFRRRSKENIKAPRHWPLCGEFTGTGEFPAQRASYAENASISWRHHDNNWLHIIVMLGCAIRRLIDGLDDSISNALAMDTLQACRLSHRNMKKMSYSHFYSHSNVRCWWLYQFGVHNDAPVCCYPAEGNYRCTVTKISSKFSLSVQPIPNLGWIKLLENTEECG